ncbi:MAG TPA: undecaprenyl-diphosphate phosphatase [Solirubrobacteraceae bacterium]|nr:undecaprenyl-diphosphate phosphatase [Solirubrobacteraceae bacterium]
MVSPRIMAVLALIHGFDAFRAIVLGALQGFSELFPISSLGHTVLFPKLFGWNQLVAYQSSSSENAWLAFIVMLHVGSALGLLIYFWRDWVAIVKAFFATLGKRRVETSNERMAWLIIAASIPTGILGLIFEHTARVATGKPEVAAIFLVVNGVVLFVAQRLMRRSEVRAIARREGSKDDGGRVLETLEYREAALLGLEQSAGLIAGISRDGMVMAGGLARGLDNSDAARMSFLMATPIILAAGLFKLPDLLGHNGDGIRGYAALACLVAAVVAVFTVHFLTRYFKRGNLIPFAAYCVIFGAAMIAYTA